MLQFLGKDSGFGDKNTCCYFEKENELNIVDCGFTAFNELKNKFDFTKYNNINIIITHLHNDHAGSLSQIVLYLYFIYNKSTNIVSKCENIKEYLKITGVPDNAYNLKDRLEDIEFIKTEHVEYLDAYGFKANINNKNIIYTGDTNTIEPFKKYLDNIDELYIDVSRYGGAHIKIEDVLELLFKLKSHGTKIILMHLDDKEYIRKVTQGKFYL